MIVDIKTVDTVTYVIFKPKDLTTLDDIQHICSGVAANYSFWATSVTEQRFVDFIKEVEPRKSYAVLIGRDDEDCPIICWGEFRNNSFVKKIRM